MKRTPTQDLKDELASTAIQITCYDRNGDVVKRVTSADAGTVEDPENGEGEQNGGDSSQNGGSTQTGGDSQSGGDDTGGKPNQGGAEEP